LREIPKLLNGSYWTLSVTFSDTAAVPEVATMVRVYAPGAGPVGGLLAIVPLPHADAIRHPENARSIARCAKHGRAKFNCANNFLRRANAIADANSTNSESCHGMGG
jgi:hypothetical protein